MTVALLVRALVQVQRAAAIIIENGCVLFAGNENEDYYSIGSGVHMGESAESAVLQEVFEETGIHYEIERLAVIHENFFNNNRITYAICFSHQTASRLAIKNLQ